MTNTTEDFQFRFLCSAYDDIIAKIDSSIKLLEAHTLDDRRRRIKDKAGIDPGVRDRDQVHNRVTPPEGESN